MNPEIKGAELIAAPQKILVLKNRALGDSVLGLASIAYLKKTFPEAQITYGVPKWVLPLYQKVKTSADSYLPISLDSLSSALSLFKRLRREKFDFILELHQSGRTANFFKFYRLVDRCPYVFHNHNISLSEAQLGKGCQILDQGVRKANIQRDLDAAWTLVKLVQGKSPGKIPSFLDNPPKMQLKNELPKNSNLYIFGIVATRKEKMWPISHFHNLAKLLTHKEILIPISINETDQALKKEFLSMGPLENVKFLESTLESLPSKLAEASLYIGNDTGLKHICVALGVKTLTLFGPEEPLEWHPYNEKEHPFFWIYNNDSRERVAYTCALKQFDTTKNLSEIEAYEISNFLENSNE